MYFSTFEKMKKKKNKKEKRKKKKGKKMKVNIIEVDIFDGKMDYLIATNDLIEVKVLSCDRELVYKGYFKGVSMTLDENYYIQISCIDSHICKAIRVDEIINIDFPRNKECD